MESLFNMTGMDISWIKWIFLLYFVLTTKTDAGEVTSTICAHSKQDVVKISKIDSSSVIDDQDSGDAGITGELLDNNTTEKCSKGSQHCFALWQEDPQNKSAYYILTQGCWDSSPGQADCSKGGCVAMKPPKALNNTKFCCCSGNLCNLNISDGYVPSSEERESVQPALHYIAEASYKKGPVILGIALVLAVMLVVVGFFVLRFWFTSRKPSPDSIHLVEAPPPHSPAFDLDSLKILEVIGRGRYGSVSRGTLNDHPVAVKIFTPQHRQYFHNERDILALPFLEHPSIVKFIGSEDRINSEGRLEYLLVLSYAPLGCLQDFLRNNTVDWPTLCKIAQSVTNGLAHLHTEVRKGDKVKPCIAHRDLNTRNILVKADGSCMLCDFGFAIRIAGSKYYQNGEEQHAETASLNDVGTLRYMAPEILEGAVNLRDCESSLKQIDIYALGLVLWEVATKCSDLYQGMEVPEYKMPFEAEVGLHPTFEQMQTLVTRHKARPLFPDIWKDTNLAVRALKETIEDCWDHDAEARLTALCVEERLSEMPVLWERHKAGIGVPGVSPTVNPTYQRSTQGYKSLSSSSSNQPSTTGTSMSDNGEKNQTSQDGLLPLSRSAGNRSSRDRISSTSENTVETILSPSESLPPSGPSLAPQSGNNMKNNVASNTVVTCPKVTVPLQPHQGRNPCMERNLMMSPVEEVAVSGNTLLGSGSKFNSDWYGRTYPDGANIDTNIFDTLQMSDNTASNSLVSNDVLSHTTRACHPIPYVQNAVHLAGTIPKQPNVPGNGHHSLPSASLSGGKHTEPKRSGPFSMFERKKGGSESSLKQGLKNLLDRKRTGKNSSALEEEQHPLRGSSREKGPGIDHQRNMTDFLQPLLGKSSDLQHLEKQTNSCPKETEVLLDCSNSNSVHTVVKPVLNGHLPNSNLELPTEVGVAKLQENHVPNGHAAVIKLQGGSLPAADVDRHSCEDSDNSSKSDRVGGMDLKVKRPTTLPVKAYSLDFQANHYGKAIGGRELDSGNQRRVGSSREKIVKRVKTPFEIKKCRFSLYDDRIMSSHSSESCRKDASRAPKKTDNLEGAAKLSKSVPIDIDALGTPELNLERCHNTGSVSNGMAVKPS